MCDNVSRTYEVPIYFKYISDNFICSSFICSNLFLLHLFAPTYLFQLYFEMTFRFPFLRPTVLNGVYFLHDANISFLSEYVHASMVHFFSFYVYD